MNRTTISIFHLFAQYVLVGIRMSFVEMESHKIRSALSIAGVLLGVASLVAMLTMVGGIDHYLNDKMAKWVGSIWYSKKWDVSEKDALSWSRSPGLKLSDGNYLLSNSKYVKEVPQTISREISVLFSGKSILCLVRGMDSASIAYDKDDITLVAGNWFNESDFSTGSPNCVISWQVAEELSKASRIDNMLSTLNRRLKIGQNIYKITGIYGPVNVGSTPDHLRKAIVVPLKTMQKYETGFNPDPGSSIQVQVTDPKKVKGLSKLIASTLRQCHRGIMDFEYYYADWVDNATSMLNNISILMTIVSCLSLMTGGLSIMNVMLSSISERIKEIGIRKSIGANNLQIFIQFITETITLSFVGGILGFLLGLTPLLFKEAILRSTNGSIEPTILPQHILFTFCMITTLGILFGLYPALKASKMNTVDALKYE